MLLSFTALCAVFTMNAQADTLTEFFTGTPTLYGTQAGGYVTGNNGYGDISKFQRFDSSTGLAATGSITGCLLWVGAKDDNGGSFDVVVRDFTGASMGVDIESVTVNLADADTSAAGFMIAEGAVGYNVAVTFANPIPFTSASDLVVGVVLPTTAGDTLGLVSNTDGDFSLAGTHSVEEWDDGTVGYLGDWPVDIAMAIYPVVDFALNVDENAIVTNVYPNPASDVLNINASVEVSTVSIIGLDGKVISTTNGNGTSVSVNVADLTSGVYLYEVATANGVTRDTFVKK